MSTGQALFTVVVLGGILNSPYILGVGAAAALYKDKGRTFIALAVLSLAAFLVVGALNSQINSLYTIDPDVYLNYKAPGEY